MLTVRDKLNQIAATETERRLINRWLKDHSAKETGRPGPQTPPEMRYPAQPTWRWLRRS